MHLDEHMLAFARACDYLAERVRVGESAPSPRALQAAYYYEVRRKFGLMAQVAQSATVAVGNAYRAIRALGHNSHPRFTSPRLVLLHKREWRFKGAKLTISLPGRGPIPFDVDGSSRHAGILLMGEPGAMNLVKRGGEYYAKISVEIPDPTPYEATGWVGVDAGIRSTAVARVDGQSPIIFSGGALREYRKKQRRTRRRLQQKGTRSARRVQTALSGREQRHVLDQMRCIAKRIVLDAHSKRRGIKLEDLRAINQSVRIPRAQRADRHAWAFRILQECIRMKAEEMGVPVLYVEPAFTSRTCPRCGDARKANRQRDAFACKHCGYRNHADVVGATNISRRPGVPYTELGGAAVNRPRGHSKTNRRRGLAVASSEKASKFSTKPENS